MITMKNLLQSGVMCSPDGKHWEPALPIPPMWQERLKDAIAVLKGEAVAIITTPVSDAIQPEGRTDD